DEKKGFFGGFNRAFNRLTGRFEALNSRLVRRTGALHGDLRGHRGGVPQAHSEGPPRRKEGLLRRLQPRIQPPDGPLRSAELAAGAAHG
ncbi:hypothetical protein CTI14_65235, partial [Methylobacterium radiotolerans]